MITVPRHNDDTFVYVPSGFDLPYLERVISRDLGQDIRIANYEVRNLCDNNQWHVSCSGATTLHLCVTLRDDTQLDLVAKFLSPDPLNVFKTDRQFDSRLSEIVWTDWWSKQPLRFLPKVYDTRSNQEKREFWIVQEYLPEMGKVPSPKPDAIPADFDCSRDVFACAAKLHAQSHQNLEELSTLLSKDNLNQARFSTFPDVIETLERVLSDYSVLSALNLSSTEQDSLKQCVTASKQRPEWVDDWNLVCVHKDIGAHNLSVGENNGKREITLVDWGASQLGPMEEEFESLRRRWGHFSKTLQTELLDHYLDEYQRLTGRNIERDLFVQRIPWACLLAVLRSIVQHLTSLQWVIHQPHAKEIVHSLIPVCEQLLEDVR